MWDGATVHYSNEYFLHPNEYLIALWNNLWFLEWMMQLNCGGVDIHCVNSHGVFTKLMPETKSRNSEDRKFWNHEMRGPSILFELAAIEKYFATFSIFGIFTKNKMSEKTTLFYLLKDTQTHSKTSNIFVVYRYTFNPFIWHLQGRHKG